MAKKKLGWLWLVLAAFSFFIAGLMGMDTFGMLLLLLFVSNGSFDGQYIGGPSSDEIIIIIVFFVIFVISIVTSVFSIYKFTKFMAMQGKKRAELKSKGNA